MFLNNQFRILLFLSLFMTALLCVYITSVSLNNDLDTEVIIFPNNPGWYFIVYDENGDSHLESHLDINFTIKNKNIFWAYGRSLDEGSYKRLLYVDDGTGSLEFLYKTSMRTYTEGYTAMRIGGKPYTIGFIYLGDRPNNSDYESSLSQLDLQKFVHDHSGEEKETDSPEVVLDE